MNITLAEDHSGTLGPEKSFTQASVIIGRDEGCDIAFDKARFPMVSRRHAHIQMQSGVISIEDLGSTNGTFVNGEPVRTPVALRPGDRIVAVNDRPMRGFNDVLQVIRLRGGVPVRIGDGVGGRPLGGDLRPEGGLDLVGGGDEQANATDQPGDVVLVGPLAHEPSPPPDFGSASWRFQSRKVSSVRPRRQ